jgi:hypothetical protein
VAAFLYKEFKFLEQDYQYANYSVHEQIIRLLFVCQIPNTRIVGFIPPSYNQDKKAYYFYVYYELSPEE